MYPWVYNERRFGQRDCTLTLTSVSWCRPVILGYEWFHIWLCHSFRAILHTWQLQGELAGPANMLLLTLSIRASLPLFSVTCSYKFSFGFTHFCYLITEGLGILVVAETLTIEMFSSAEEIFGIAQSLAVPCSVTSRHCAVTWSRFWNCIHCKKIITNDKISRFLCSVSAKTSLVVAPAN